MRSLHPLPTWLKKALRMSVGAGILLFPAVRLAAPTITRITPVLGQPGDIVMIEGTGFGTNPAQINVRFGPNRAPVLAVPGSGLTVQVPNGQPLGTTQVTVDGSNRLSFIVVIRSKVVAFTNPPV